MIEVKDGKVYQLVEHWKYLNPYKDAPRKLINQKKYEKRTNIYYVHDGH